MRKQFPHATLLPVMTKNKLPFAFAEKIGLKIEEVSFDNNNLLLDMRKNYIIVNDIATRGGPIAAMMKNIALSGGNVCAIAVLAREDLTPAAVVSQRLAA